ncbi:hypothetical protein GCM10027454_14280 [Algoriphagus aestuariicola]|jgi:hypothetical protein
MKKFDLNFPLDKINSAPHNSGIDLKEIFQQPDTRTAMNLRNVKCDVTFRLVPKIEYLPNNLGVIEVVKTVLLFEISFLAFPGIGIQSIELAEIVLCQNFIYQLTSLAAELLSVKANGFEFAVFSAVKALGIGVGWKDLIHLNGLLKITRQGFLA